MRFYEYLRRLYMKELASLLVFIIGATIFFYYNSPSKNSIVWLFGGAVSIAIIIEFFWLNKHKSITTFKSLISPRTFHLIVFYILIIALSLTFETLKYEYILFIPFGVASVGFHPFLHKKTMAWLYTTGTLSALALFAKDTFYDNMYAENMQHNTWIIAATFIITALLLYQTYVVSQRSLEILKNHKKDLKDNVNLLTKANSDIDAFIYKLSHDVRGPVTSIEADFKIINQLTGEKSIKDISKEGYRSAKQLEYLIDKLTDFSKNNNTAILTSPVDLNSIFMRHINYRQDLIDAAGIDVNLIPYQGDIFYSDPVRLNNIIENLLDNCIKYSDPKKANKVIDLNIAASATGVTISFSDNGIGIPEHHINHIFKMFYRGNQELEGQGLGLYVVIEAVKRLSGTISVSSDVGEGSRFDIYLPSKKLL